MLCSSAWLRQTTDVSVQLQSHLLIKHLIQSLPTHPLLIPLSPHTSQALFHHRHLQPWTRAELITAMKNICRKWGFWDGDDDESKAPDEGGDDREEAIGGVSMLSHSNGSVGHAWSKYSIFGH